jgi:5-methylcytosine-specific restriction endonuclease McrA
MPSAPPRLATMHEQLSASACPDLKFAKPEPRKVVKARSKREDEKARRECLAIVRKRDAHRCRRCRADKGRMDGHEILPRSLGGDPHDPRNVLLLCEHCHMFLVHHEKTVRIEGNDASGEVLFVDVERSDVGKKLHRAAQ